MDRRDLLTGVASILGLQSLALPITGVAADARAAGAARRRVRPGDPRWPSALLWNKLNAEVGGALIRPSPLVASASPQDLHNPLYIGDQAGGTQVSGWVDAWEPAVSAYAVAARNASDVVAAVNFARRNNLRLVVKGGGHSYQGTSNAPDSLLVWTRAMNRIVLHDSFIGEGCRGKISAQPAVTLDAGVMWIDAYDAVTTRAGRYVQGGGCATVGVAGLIQSGGFGSFSKGFGTASASLLEARIVTADGVLRTVNPCQDAELYWALKGGGGGSWGVITQLTLSTHDLPEFFGAAVGTVQARTDAAFRELILRVMSFYHDQLLNPHWGEQIAIGPGNRLKISMVCQGLDASSIEATWRPLFDFCSSNPDLTIAEDLWAGAVSARHWWDVVDRKRRGSKSMVSDPRPGAPATHAWWQGDQDQVGMLLYGFESAWLPASLLDVGQRERLADALFAASRLHEVELHFNKGLAGASASNIAAAADTAMNPQVLAAFALAIIAEGGAAAYPGIATGGAAGGGRGAGGADVGAGIADAAAVGDGARPDVVRARRGRQTVGDAMRALKAVAPSAGSYVSESDFFEPAWQRSFWGDHHVRLRAVKAKYDPEGLFFVHHGVGSEGWSDDGFVRTGG